MRMRLIYPKSLYKPTTDTLLVPRPREAQVGGKPLAGRELLEWTRTVITTLAA